MTQKPAVSLAAVAGRRQATLELAQRVEQEGFSGIYCPSFGERFACWGATGWRATADHARHVAYQNAAAGGGDASGGRVGQCSTVAYAAHCP
jgi:hypothetical protein